jgi:hypothetical protein
VTEAQVCKYRDRLDRPIVTLALEQVRSAMIVKADKIEIELDTLVIKANNYKDSYENL